VSRALPLLLLAAACAAPVEHLPAPGALGPYSAGVACGGQVFLSGKIAPAEARGGTFEREAEAALDVVAADLARLGLGLQDAVSVTVHLSDIALYGAFNSVYARRFAEPWPARTCVAVAGLPGGARVEVTVTARRR